MTSRRTFLNSMFGAAVAAPTMRGDAFTSLLRAHEVSGTRAAVDVADDESWLVVRRGSLRLVCNMGRQPVSVPLDAPTAQTVLAFDPVARQVTDGSIALGGHGVALLRVE